MSRYLKKKLLNINIESKMNGRLQENVREDAVMRIMEVEEIVNLAGITSMVKIEKATIDGGHRADRMINPLGITSMVKIEKATIDGGHRADRMINPLGLPTVICGFIPGV
ncbi:78 kDa glucose-regulated protein homolog [Striga asiatica]|uniref:78 kDa glucose-regulated protein homolog n=1 Tax=Striga asiatica TaxID=4170 RepID=A0A5A7PFY0_STRAF|nr:78 kDa glucose-regulated protein homolog [Striga asiatica]